MQALYWPENFGEYLKNKFEYDPTNGVVRYKDKGSVRPGPKNKMVGTVTKTGLLVNVAFEGRQNSLRLARLALFLHTGKQYRKVYFKDNDPFNLKLDNLVSGQEITEEPESNKAFAEHVWRQAKLKYEAENKRVEARDIEGVKKIRALEEIEELTPMQRAERGERVVIGQKSGDEIWEEVREAERELMTAYCTTPYGNGEWKAGNELEDKFNSAVLSQGLWTGCDMADLQLHVDFFGTPLGLTVESYDYDKYLLGTAASAEKWEHDLWYSIRLLSNVNKQIISPEQVTQIMARYEWKGERVEKPLVDINTIRLDSGLTYPETIEKLKKETGSSREQELEYIRYCLRNRLRLVD
jgi:hypothetical protein